MSVYFGEDGKIIGAASVWREVEEFLDYPIITLQQAIDQIKSGNAVIFKDITTETSGEVENINLVYFDRPLGYNQQYVIPHYVMEGHTPNGKKFKAITRAVPDKYISEVPYKKYQKSKPTPRKELVPTPDGPDEKNN